MTTLHTDALVLRMVDVGESDRILHLLTPRTGRLAVVAKGARRSVKRFPGTLDLFNHLHVQVERRRPTSMPRLELARLRRMFHGVREHPTRFALGCYLLELLDRLAPEGGSSQELTALFRFALESLDLFDAAEPDARLRTLLELRALDVLGLRPELARCVRCGERLSPGPPEPRDARIRALARGTDAPGGHRPLAFHVGEGGPVCGRCARDHEVLLPIHLGTLRALEQSLQLGLPQLGRIALGGSALREARTLVSRFLRFHVGVELRSERFLDERLARPGGD